MSTGPADLGIPGLINVERIGAGGNAIVYRARQPELDRMVVVKVLMAVDGEATRRRFDRERRAMGRLSQAPGIAPVYDSGFTPGGQPYLIMPFYEAGSLQDRIESDGALAAQDMQRIGVEICEAVQRAHENGVLHRDLKPANILMARSGRADVADFGIAQLLDDSGGTSQSLTMTPLYTAPEIFDGANPGVAGDVYSLGALFYALLNGRPAYTDGASNPQVLALMKRINDDPLPPLPKSVPNALASVVGRAMHKDPNRRYRSAGELGAALAALDLDSASRRSGMARWAVAAVFGVAVIAAAVAAVFFVRADNETQVVAPALPTVEPTATPQPAAQGTAFDPETAGAGAQVAAVVVESFSCIGVERSNGVLLSDGLILTGPSIGKAPWYVSVTIADQSFEANVVSIDSQLGLTTVSLVDAEGVEFPVLARARDQQPVGIAGPGGNLVETTLVADTESEVDLYRASMPAAARIAIGDAVVDDRGSLVGLVSENAPLAITPIVGPITDGWQAERSNAFCDSGPRRLNANQVDRVRSPEIIELMYLQQLSNAYAYENWDRVREMELARSEFATEIFVDGWRPLRQGFVYPVERTEVDGVIEWRIGLIGHETWEGTDITTLFCVNWAVDVAGENVRQTDEETVVIYGPGEDQPRRTEFVDPGDLESLISTRCAKTGSP